MFSCSDVRQKIFRRTLLRANSFNTLPGIKLNTDFPAGIAFVPSSSGKSCCSVFTAVVFNVYPIGKEDKPV